MLYTAQLARWSRLPPRIETIDISVKTGVKPWNIFAPTWKMVTDIKDGQISEKQYIEQYYTLMRQRYKTDRNVFDMLIKKAIQSDVALACYCPSYTFCHRLLLKDILLKIEPKLIYAGEYEIEQELTLF